MFLFTWVATMKIGVFDVMPLVHAGDVWTIFINQFIVLFMGSQMLINWFGIRYWISSYNLYKKRFGEDDSKVKDNILFQCQYQVGYSSSLMLCHIIR